VRTVLKEVEAEMNRQLELWGDQTGHPDGTGNEVDKQAATYAREDCNKAFKEGKGTWKDILLEEVREAFAESDEFKLIEELTQTAAVCCSWIEAVERRMSSRLDAMEAKAQEMHERLNDSLTQEEREDWRFARED
jgi:hypothetical protein